MREIHFIGANLTNVVHKECGMYKDRTKLWKKQIEQKGKYPVYKLIADLIAQDIETGSLQPNDKIPPMRDMASQLGINYSTVSRAYTEAKKRGLIETVTGAGSFIRGKVPAIKQSMASYELMMNMVIEPAIPTLIDEMKDVALSTIATTDLYSIMRYQYYGGTEESNRAVLSLIQRRLPDARLERVITTQGVHSTISALLTILCEDGQILCVDSITYPGIKPIAAQLGRTLHALDRDDNGPTAKSFENACKTHNVAALYLNPTMQNPTCTTISKNRREALCDVAMRYNVAIIEDDSYGLLSDTDIPPLAHFAPELTFYLGGFSKCLGPGIRAGFMLCPNKRKTEQAIGTLRSLNVMGVPLINKILSNWINQGTLDHMISAIRREANARRQIVLEVLEKYQLNMEPNAFHFWLTLPKTFVQENFDFAAELRKEGISAVASTAFSTDNHPPQAIRVCIGGPSSRINIKENLQVIRNKLFEYEDQQNFYLYED